MDKLVEKNSDESLLAVEKQLLRRGLIFIRNLNKKDFLNKYKKDTTKGLLEIIDFCKFSDTYYSRSKKKQCDFASFRSFGDLFRIMRYYYPGITFKEVRSILLHLINERFISTTWCYDIKKRVVMINSGDLKERAVWKKQSIQSWDSYTRERNVDEFNLV